MAGQIIWTLSQVPGVNGGVRITVNGAPYAVREQNAQGVLPVPGMPWLDPIPWQKSDQTFGLVGSGLVRLNRTARDTDRVPVNGPLGDPAGGAHRPRGESAGGDQIAVVTNTDDVLIGDPDQPPTRIVHGARMLRPPVRTQHRAGVVDGLR